MANKLPSATYYPKLDSVRAIAVLFVLFHHYFFERITSLLQLGSFGVDVFFTLSGFLITGILISYRSIKPIGAALKKFYFRRILRIFPIYYLYILIIVLIFREEISRKLIMWVSFYGFNFYVIYHGWNKFYFSHLWSLAVEEQFYLVWPFLILIFPFKYLRNLIVLAILISIGFSYYNLHKDFVSYMHPISCMQALAIGALVKYFTIFHFDKCIRIERKLIQFLLFFSALWICSLIAFDHGFLYAYPLLRTFASLTTAVLIIHIVSESRSKRLDKILGSKSLQFIGRISYGIYLYHVLIMVLLDPPIHQIVNNLTSKHNLLRYNTYIITTPLYSAITILIAWLSFKYIESPINRLKNRNFNPFNASSQSTDKRLGL
jgi:peptidoglycan/LPS O-acetylase OafA/YrhL